MPTSLSLEELLGRLETEDDTNSVLALSIQLLEAQGVLEGADLQAIANVSPERILHGAATVNHGPAGAWRLGELLGGPRTWDPCEVTQQDPKCQNEFTDSCSATCYGLTCGPDTDCGFTCGVTCKTVSQGTNQCQDAATGNWCLDADTRREPKQNQGQNNNNPQGSDPNGPVGNGNPLGPSCPESIGPCEPDSLTCYDGNLVKAVVKVTQNPTSYPTVDTSYTPVYQKIIQAIPTWMQAVAVTAPSLVGSVVEIPTDAGDKVNKLTQELCDDAATHVSSGECSPGDASTNIVCMVGEHTVCGADHKATGSGGCSAQHPWTYQCGPMQVTGHFIRHGLVDIDEALEGEPIVFRRFRRR